MNTHKIAAGVITGTLIAAGMMPLVAGAAPLLNENFLFGGENATAENFASEVGVNPKQTLPTTVAKIINVALSLLGIVAVVIILIGGFKWMTAGGNEEKVGEARKLILAGIVGLAIILSAFAIAKFVISALVKATAT